MRLLLVCDRPAKRTILTAKPLTELYFPDLCAGTMSSPSSDSLTPSQSLRSQRTTAALGPTADATEPSQSGRAQAARTLTVTGLNHALHDGYSDLIYVLLPVWQTEFALSYGLLALLRGLYSGTMAGLQIPVGRIAERIDGKIILTLGTALSALGYVCVGLSGSVLALGLALALAGAGSSTQHPIASAAVSRAYGEAARGPLGIYNFTGDLGKAAIPALTSMLLVIMSWRHALLLVASAGLLVATCVALWMPVIGKGHASKPTASSHRADSNRGGFAWLLCIGILDSAVRMGLLTFLPFLLRGKGASLPTIGYRTESCFLPEVTWSRTTCRAQSLTTSRISPI